ncbi:MAG: endonuclease/exonuclease/phosphatase family protein [Acetobacteraceae bacterium]|nr:endonuclease/exonuclease/phosphatase family protein [Acetobacteraceae bacterium]
MRLASFNVENLFSRAKAFDAEDGAAAKRALDAFAEFNALIAAAEYGEAEKQRIHELIETLGLQRSDDGEFVRLRQNRGEFLVRRRGGALDIVAGGRGDWTGWLELEREPVDDTAMRMTARVVRDVGADVFGIVEAENRPALKGFSDAILPLVDAEPYARVMLIDGNDPRGIDCALMARGGFPIASMLSHVDDTDDAGIVFSRDCPEYHLDTNEGRLVVLVNHFKSKSGGSRSSSDRKRRRQAAAVARIYGRLREAGNDLVAVVGDLNDTPPEGADDPLAPLLRDTDLTDISALDGHDDGGRPGTYGDSAASNKIDHILLSPALRERAGASGLFRRGMWPGVRPVKWETYPEIDPRQGGEERHAASDHAALWVDLDLRPRSA